MPGCWCSSAPMMPTKCANMSRAFAIGSSARKVMRRNESRYTRAQLGGDTRAIWEVREGGLGATAFPPGDKNHWPGWEDSAVPPERVGDYIRDLKKLYAKYDYEGAMYGHFGQGCVHSRFLSTCGMPTASRSIASF